TPNTYLTLSTRETYRNFLLKHPYQKYTYSGFCFEDAYVETMIFEIGGVSKGINEVFFVPEPEDYVHYEMFITEPYIFKKNIFSRFFIPTEFNKKLNSVINKKLSPLRERFTKTLLGRKSEKENIEEYISTLKRGDLTLLGLISKGEQGLVTGNNSKYIANISGNGTDKQKQIDKKFIDKLKDFGFENLNLNELTKNRDKY